MAKYKINEGARYSDDIELDPEYIGGVFEWDGVTVDEDGDIFADLGGLRATYVLPEYVTLIPEDPEPEMEPAASAKATVRTQSVTRVGLELTLDEAQTLLDLFYYAVAGDDQDSRRRHTDAIYEALRGAGLTPRGNWADITGSVLFEKAVS